MNDLAAYVNYGKEREKLKSLLVSEVNDVKASINYNELIIEFGKPNNVFTLGLEESINLFKCMKELGFDELII